MDHNDLYQHFLKLKEKQDKEFTELYQEQFKCLKVVLESIPSFWKDLKTGMTVNGTCSVHREIGALGSVDIKMDIENHTVCLGVNYTNFFNHAPVHLQTSNLYSAFFHYVEYKYNEVVSWVPDAKDLIITPLKDGIRICVDYQVSPFKV